MKYIRSYKKFKDFKNKNSQSSEFYFYNLGKKTNLSIFECGLISDGFRERDIVVLKENINFYKMDDLLIETIYQNLKNKNIISEEIINLTSVWNTTKNVWNKGVKFLGDTFNNFKEFLKKIQKYLKKNDFYINIIGTKKIKELTLRSLSNYFKNKKVLLNLDLKKCFNGCRPPKKRRKRQKELRIFK